MVSAGLVVAGRRGGSAAGAAQLGQQRRGAGAEAHVRQWCRGGEWGGEWGGSGGASLQRDGAELSAEQRLELGGRRAKLGLLGVGGQGHH